MAELSYKDQQDLKNIEKIREHLQILPRFCGEYFRSLEIRKSTNTRKNYAYDLGVFFYFLKMNNPYFKDKDIHTLPIEVLDMITAMDVEEYLSYLESYTKDGKLYTNREEGKARKLSSLKSFYGIYAELRIPGTLRSRRKDDSFRVQLFQLLQGDAALAGLLYRLTEKFLRPAQLGLPQQLPVLVGHKAALAGNVLQKTVPLQLLIGPLGGDDRDAQLLGQQTHRGQGLPRRQRPGADLLLHLVGDLLIDGFSAGIA